MTIVQSIGVGLLVAFSLGFLLLLKRRRTQSKSRGSTSRLVVYDKAEHHLLDEELQSQEGFNAYIYGGMYLGWIIDSGLHSPEYFEGDPSLLERFRARKATVSELYGAVGEALFSNMLSEKGNLFTAHYFESGYPQDYEELLAPGEMAYELVADTWENYARMRARLDDRYQRRSEDVLIRS